MTPRVVLDTNILVSALLKPQGLEDQVLRLALSGKVELYTSSAVLAEYTLVLPRPKLKLRPLEIERALTELRKASKIVHPHRTLAIAGHEPDNRFLECADRAIADFLITGNAKDFPKQWKTTKVVNARQFLEHLIPLQSE